MGTSVSLWLEVMEKDKALPMKARANNASRGRGSHSLTSQLNLSAFHGIGGARRGCVAHVKGVLWGVKGV